MDMAVLKRRLVAVALVVAQFLPWYSSQALIDSDMYIGNPLPAVDWFVGALSLAAVLFPRLLRLAALAVFGSVGLTLVVMYGDHAEGVSVAFEYGIVVAAASAALGLWLASRVGDLSASDHL